MHSDEPLPCLPYCSIPGLSPPSPLLPSGPLWDPTPPAGISEPMQVAETFTFQLPDDISCPLDHDHSTHTQKQQQLIHSSKGEAAEEAPTPKPTKKRRSSSGGSVKGDEGSKGSRGGSRRGSRRGSSAGEGAEAEGVGDSEGLPPALSSVARLDTCVTVVDAATFLDNLTSIEELADRYAYMATTVVLCWRNVSERTHLLTSEWRYCAS